MVEHKEQRRLAALVGQRQAGLQLDIRIFAALKRNALVVGLAQPAIEIVAVDSLDGDADLLGQLNDLTKRAGLLRAGGDQEPLEHAPLGAQRLADGVPAVEYVGHTDPNRHPCLRMAPQEQRTPNKELSELA